MLVLSPNPWKDYELIDSGNFEKLERFGKYITIRPEPQAVWRKELTDKEWKNRANVHFTQKSSASGVWNKLKEMPDQWQITYGVEKDLDFTLRLGLTSFKHVGVFPEQSVNWDFIYRSIKTIGLEKPRFLNLFAYTGAASLAARAAGAEVTHVDSIKQVVTWSNQNMMLSGLTDIRWVVEDALKFVKREERRGNTYNGIILDPPAYGHGPSGEKWKLEDNILEMVEGVLNLLDKDKHFLILNAYSLGFSSLILENLFMHYDQGQKETGELFLSSSTGQKLPLGVFARLKNF